MAKQNRVNENSQAFVIARFYNENGTPTVPTTVEYKIHNFHSQALIKAITSISPAEEVTISIAPEDNTVFDRVLQFERHILTVTGDRGLASEQNVEMDIWVRNLHFVAHGTVSSQQPLYLAGA